MQQKIVLKGLASGKVTEFDVSESQMDKTLLEFLQENNQPIASSCSGVGVCQRCVVNGEILSCDLTVSEFLKSHCGKLTISYL